MSVDRFGPPDPHINLRIVWGLGRWVAEQRGAEVLARVAAAADISPDQLDGRNHWVSYDRLEAFLAECRALMASDDEFEDACIYRMSEAYGPFRFALWAVTPRLMYKQAVRTMHMVSSICTVELVAEGANFMRVKYVPDRPESYLMSLSRFAQTSAIPTLWGLPKAQLTVHSRDDWGRSEYEVKWRVKLNWLPPLAGATLGAIVTAVVYFGLLPSGPVAWALLPVLGAAVGHIMDLHRTNRLNRNYGESQNEALQELASAAVEAQREILELGRRQVQWTHLVEEQLAERTAGLTDMIESLGRQQEDRQDRLRGMSHDLRSPLQIITSAVDMLHARGDSEQERAECIGELEGAVTSMRVHLDQLMGVVVADARMVRHTPQKVDVAALTTALRQRLKAFVFDQAVRTSVFSTREAPDHIMVDRLVLDRVLDNLLTNAAKYTERGSILVEVGGTPGYLTIKVSDTGRGIEREKMEAIFVPEGSDVKGRAPRSFGLGLSIVLRLMGEIGGRLEVMSRVGRGTTFWAHFPVKPTEAPVVASRSGEGAYAELLERVVTIRRPTP
ncbi:MAG: HAMP domain-containing histidine kinase [Deltaproteobacteria bacterium]|nr:HAMP domain-containing histidine kinase [Deltaproteobacteria bacterium]